MLMTMDTPMTNSRINGSIQVEEARMRIRMQRGMTTITMVAISWLITPFMLRFSSAAPVMYIGLSVTVRISSKAAPVLRE